MSLTPGQPTVRASSTPGSTTVTFEDERRPTHQWARVVRGRGLQPRPNVNSAQPVTGPIVPFYSWFAGITQVQAKPFQFTPGQGVPLSHGIPTTECKGYWNRHDRKGYKNQNGQIRPLKPRWYFYYLGTGPRASAKYGEQIDGVIWVAHPNANTNVPSNIQDRDPSIHEALPTRFAPGTVVPAGYYIEGSGGSRSTSRHSSASRSNSSVRSANSSNMADEIAALVLEKLNKNKNPQRSANQERSFITKKARHKRNPTDKASVQLCYGNRSAKQNFGGGDMLKLGTKHPKFPILAELAPSAAGFFFGSKLNLVKLHDKKEGASPKEVYELRYEGSIKFDSNISGFDTIIELLNENLDAYQSNTDSALEPKPQRKVVKKVEKDTPQDRSLLDELKKLEGAEGGESEL